MLPIFREIKKFRKRKILFIYLKSRNIVFLVKINLINILQQRLLKTQIFKVNFEKLIFH